MSAGSPDPTFGTDGHLTTDFGTPGVLTGDGVVGVAIQPRGRIVAAGLQPRRAHGLRADRAAQPALRRGVEAGAL